jgi:AraC family transcriptional regulator, ethanolamine operon transcriptional activator
VPVTAQHLTPAFNQAAFRLEDPDEFSVAVSRGSLKADFLAAPLRPTFIEQFQTPTWSIDFHEAHVKARIFGGLPKNWASLGIMCSPTPSIWYGLEAPSGTLVCTPPGEPIDGCTTSGFHCFSVGISPQLWEHCRRAGSPDAFAFGSCGSHALSPSTFTRLIQTVSAVKERLRHASHAPALAGSAADEAALLVTWLGITAWELRVGGPPTQDSLRNRARLARRAEALMRHHLGEPLQTPDLCQSLGVSRRELEYAFRSTFDKSPRDFLQALRLNAIRRELKRNDAPIIDVAFQYGMTHLGRFAGSYRKLFGEKPSQTARGGALRRR